MSQLVFGLLRQEALTPLCFCDLCFGETMSLQDVVGEGVPEHDGADLGELWVPARVRHCAWESDVRLLPSPNILIDISETWPRKEQALLAHESQNLGPNIEKIKAIDRYWGIANGCELAEPFTITRTGRYQ